MPKQLWKSAYFSTVFPLVFQNCSSVCSYFSTACGKECGKGAFCTASVFRICGFFQKAVGSRLITIKTDFLSTKFCGKNLHRIVENLALLKYSTIPLWRSLRLFHAPNGKEYPQRQISCPCKSKIRNFNRFFDSDTGLSKKIHRKSHRFKHFFHDQAIKKCLATIIFEF